jgi:hypothetical protein
MAWFSRPFPSRHGWSRLPGVRHLTAAVIHLLALLFQLPARAQDRIELINQSSQPWTLALVEEASAGVGTLVCLDKFSGRSLATLARTGDQTQLPPRSRLLLEFQRRSGYLFLGFILRDERGCYGEYVASLEFLTSRRITLHLVSERVGEPMNRLDDGSIREFVNNAIDLGENAITIRANTLASPEGDPASAPARAGSPPPPGPGPLR